MSTIEERVKNFTEKDLLDCIVLESSPWWDDGIKTKATLIKLKNKLLGTKICPTCHIDMNSEKVIKNSSNSDIT